MLSINNLPPDGIFRVPCCVQLLVTTKQHESGPPVPHLPFTGNLSGPDNRKREYVTLRTNAVGERHYGLMVLAGDPVGTWHANAFAYFGPDIGSDGDGISFQVRA